MEAFSVGQLHRSENGSLCLGGQVVQRDASSTPADTDVVHGGDQIITGAWCGEGWYEISLYYYHYHLYTQSNITNSAIYSKC
jgi:hypothetical protein